MAALLLPIVAGCGGGESSSSPPEQAAHTDSGLHAVIPDRPPPRKLVVRELKKGTGRVARVGDEVTIQYIGVHWDGRVYSDSSTFSRPPTLTIGVHQLSFGLDRGIRGMRVGGRREILVPRDRIYYPYVKKHAPIPAGDGLVFVVELLAVH